MVGLYSLASTHPETINYPTIGAHPKLPLPKLRWSERPTLNKKDTLVTLLGARNKAQQSSVLYNTV